MFRHGRSVLWQSRKECATDHEYKRSKRRDQTHITCIQQKDSRGHYTFPKLRQRPILLMGPPGIGKTAIMEQVAEECNVGLVAYTITHHTRQSAVGLPRIVTRCYNGKEISITEYTLSEIIASVYDCMERIGKKKESCLLMRSTVYPRLLRLRCCSFFRIRHLEATAYRKDG